MNSTWEVSLKVVRSRTQAKACLSQTISAKDLKDAWKQAIEMETTAIDRDGITSIEVSGVRQVYMA